MDYKQHKGNLRGKIKDKTERKLYNKRVRSEGKNADTRDGQSNTATIKNPSCLSDDTNCGYKTWDGKCNCEDDKCRQKQQPILV